ncbi:putative atp synthase subunit mitochondrial protein [Golovinomyces cichoracearum]|uniref:Putative atp synthase subunit mitochondrial protein n=1 Tax=Golovinomyces cichoracearum TaxID=62708 RepID=A0A420IQM2_9PEZI|nr:putative atp synthase subunit mitochondrial protein [Golovinomyces cichoracearum]
MMATEATSANVVTVSSTSNELIFPSDDKSKRYDIILEERSASKDEQPRQNLDILETKNNSAILSVCGGSDSESFKADTSKREGNEKGHFRTTSAVKKPTSFKPVSVNKKFLATKSSASVSTAKFGDKSLAGSVSSQPVPLVGGNGARPRLVAKSGPGLHTSPRTATIPNGVKVGGAPDASAVWNKNRLPPPPEPKRYSDEELKQNYGIHLATRLQSDDAGKQANWADIDDDEDWAPNTMEWADGTKVTLPQTNEKLPSNAISISSPLESVADKENTVEPIKHKSSVPTKILASSQIARPPTFSGRAGLVLKGALEKSSSISKPSGPPAVVKSPWAPLPPVEKVAPIATEAPQHQQPRQTRLVPKDVSSINKISLQPPAKQIAADDFRRNWRDSPNGSRELYNAQSGRYEPANEKRRGSLRNEVRPHQPSVLQRSHHENSVEPSPVSQTHRAGVQDISVENSPGVQIHRNEGQDSHSRRRNSSNLSVSSEKASIKMSRGDVPNSQEIIDIPRGSLVVNDEPNSPVKSSSSGQQPYHRNSQSQIWQSRVVPLTGHRSPQTNYGKLKPIDKTENQNQCNQTTYEDIFEAQKKAMQVKRELAIARRREQEEKETAEREERIKLKLASMGPSPEKVKKESQKQCKSSLSQNQTRGPSKLVPDETNKIDLEVVKSSVDSPESKEKSSLPSAIESNSAGKQISSDVRPNGNQILQSVSPENQVSQGSRPQSWQNNTTDRFKPWAPAPSQHSSSRNVWGPPSNDRTLGNGTFNPELSRLPEISSHSGPIGPLSSNRNNPLGQSREYSRPAPIGPPNRRQTQVSLQESNIRSAVVNSGWGSLPNKIAEEDARQAQRQEIEMARVRDLREKGLLTDPPPPVVHDTWRQVSMKENGSRSKIQSNNTKIHNEPAKSWQDQEHIITTQKPVEAQEIMARRPLDSIGTQEKFSDAWKTPNISAHPIRDSRFFPNNKDLRTTGDDPNITHGRSESPTPPPPTQQGHPAYDGDVTHPHVSFPRPPPIVKLPPPITMAPIGPPKPTSFAAVVATPVIPAVNRNPTRVQGRAPQTQDIRREEPVAGNWQDKINSLIGRKYPPPKLNSFAVDSSSKKTLEVPNQQKLATVSLPSQVSGDFSTGVGSVETKPASEICFEEQEMGSLPPIKMPLKPPAAAWDLAPSPKPLPRKFLVSQSTSLEAIKFPQQIINSNLSLTVKFPGQEESKNVLIQVTRQRSGHRRGNTRTSASQRHNSSSNQRFRARDDLGSFPSSNLDQTSNIPDLGISSRGRFRRHSNSWKRNSFTPVQT